MLTSSLALSFIQQIIFYNRPILNEQDLPKVWMINWLILTAWQPVLGYFVPIC